MRLDELFALREWGTFYNSKKAEHILHARGWWPTTVPNMYRHDEAPGYSIDLDIDSPEGKGPFKVFQGDQKIGHEHFPPYAQHLMMRR